MNNCLINCVHFYPNHQSDLLSDEVINLNQVLVSIKWTENVRNTFPVPSFAPIPIALPSFSISLDELPHYWILILLDFEGSALDEGVWDRLEERWLPDLLALFHYLALASLLLLDHILFSLGLVDQTSFKVINIASHARVGWRYGPHHLIRALINHQRQVRKEILKVGVCNEWLVLPNDFHFICGQIT